MKEYKDPVCGMMVSAKTAADNTKFHGKEYFFCARGCKEKFVEDPKRYLFTRTVLAKGESKDCPCPPQSVIPNLAEEPLKKSKERDFSARPDGHRGVSVEMTEKIKENNIG